MKKILILVIILILTALAAAHEGHHHGHDHHGHDHHGDHHGAHHHHHDENGNEIKGEEPVKSKVVYLTDVTFDEYVSQHTTLVKFFAPWCGHCKALAPIWEEAAADYSDVATFAKVDCTQNEALCQKHGIQGYPTLVLFANGNAFEYGGERDIKSFVSFIKRMTGPALVQVNNAEELNKFATGQDVYYLFYGDAKEAEEMEQAAKAFQSSVSFAHVKDNSVGPVKVESTPAVVAVTPDQTFTFSGTFDASSVAQWIGNTRFGLVAELGPATFNELRKVGKPIVIFAIKATNQEEKNKAITLSRAVAPKFLERFSFTWLDGEKWANYLQQSYEIGQDQLPRVVVFDENKKKFFDQSVTSEDSFSTFLDSVFSGADQGKNLDRTPTKTPFQTYKELAETYILANLWVSVAGIFVAGFLLGRITSSGKKQKTSPKVVAAASSEESKEEKKDEKKEKDDKKKN